VSLDELLQTSDVVTIHTPLTDRTRGMIGAAQIGLMKPTAVLVNTARGPIVDEAALIEALQRGAIGGAGLDVTATEPLPADSPLVGMDNVFLTPHLAGLTLEARQKALTFAAENANRLCAGESPLGVVDPFE
jgi:D-3-phosphoglycerate dehydrogenase